LGVKIQEYIRGSNFLYLIAQTYFNFESYFAQAPVVRDTNFGKKLSATLPVF